MIRKLILIALLLLSYNSNAQKSLYEDDITIGLLIRGKIFGMYLIEDYLIMNITAGAEFRFAKNFSFGADFVHMNTVIEQEQYNDPARPDYYEEYWKKNPRNCLLLDLRYYLFREKLQDSYFKPYLL